MKAIIFSLVLIVFFSCKSTRKGDDLKNNASAQIKVAAYNVEYSKNATANEIGEMLKSYDFDVVCFSEAPGGDWTRIAGATMGLDHVIVGRYSTAGHADKYKTIASKTPLYAYEEVLMADTLHTATKAKTKIKGNEVSIYSVHFPFGWRDQAHIDETTNKITTFVSYLGERRNEEMAVVMGDFNFIPSNSDSTSMYYEMFKDIGLDVSWKELGIDCTRNNTYDALKPEDQGSGEVIDHIVYNTKNMTAVDGGIIEMEKPLSDHKPVWALLKVKNKTD